MKARATRHSPAGLLAALLLLVLSLLPCVAAAQSQVTREVADTYDPQGRPEKLTQPSGVVSRSRFDPYSGRIVQAGAGQGSDTSLAALNIFSQRYVWDSLGQLQSRSDDHGDAQNSATTDNFSHDELSRLTQYQVASVSQGSRSVELKYNGLGKLIEGNLPEASTRVMGTLRAAAIGGTMSVIGGGKFSNGAMTGPSSTSSTPAVGPMGARNGVWRLALQPALLRRAPAMLDHLAPACWPIHSSLPWGPPAGALRAPSPMRLGMRCLRWGQIVQAVLQAAGTRIRALRPGSAAVLLKSSQAPTSQPTLVGVTTQVTHLIECRAEVSRLLQSRMRFRTARSHRGIHPVRRFILAQTA